MDKYKANERIYEYDLNHIDNSGYIALYHALSMEVIFIKRIVYDALTSAVKHNDVARSDKKIVDELISKQVFVPINFDDKNILSETAESLTVIRPTTLRLQLTEMCNLNCTYCQIERNYKNNTGLHMSKETAIRSLKLFNRFAPVNTPKTIILTGGEPTLNFEVIKELFMYAKENFDSYRFILFSNGVSITEEMAATFKANNVLVLISLDGNEAQHNIFRKDHSGKGSFNATIKGFNICKKQGCSVGISGVIGTHNVNSLEKEILDFFLDIRPNSLGLNFPHYLLNSDNSKVLPMEDYAYAIIAAYKKLRSYGIHLENINRLIEPFVKQKVNAKECAALGRGITVLPDGMVGPCKTLLVAGKMGRHLNELEKIERLDDEAEFAKWCNRSTYTLNCCKGCFGVSLCGTGCAYDSFVVNGNIDGVDKRTCIFIEKVLGFLLEDLYGIVKNDNESDVYMPTQQDRQRIYSSIELKDTDLKRSAGHEI